MIRGNEPDLEALFPGLREKVEEYISKHPHKAEYGKSFKFGKFEVSDITTKMINFVPLGADYEDLNGTDQDWNKGLSEIGQEYKIRLALPHWIYEK